MTVAGVVCVLICRRRAAFHFASSPSHQSLNQGWHAQQQQQQWWRRPYWLPRPAQLLRHQTA